MEKAVNYIAEYLRRLLDADNLLPWEPKRELI